LKSSADSPNSSRRRALEAAALLALLTALSAAAAAWHFSRGYLLYYGDAQAHLAIARRLIDSRTPNYEQIGTVWLPVPHLLTAPFARNDEWWRNGLAGTFPAAVCFVLAGLLLFLAVRRATGSPAAAWTAAALFATNPNLLYLQATAMTEGVFFCGLAMILWALAWHGESGSRWALIPLIGGAWIASLTRYEGWILIPAAALLLAVRRRPAAAVLFTAAAAAAPLYWLAHNWWIYGDPLEFYHGPYSAKAIYARQLEGGMARYPGDGDWTQALRYFGAASRLALGWPLVIAGAAGLLGAMAMRHRWLAAFALLPPAFYVWSLYSSGTPIFVPHLWPYAHYNTRYGLALLPAAATGAASLTAVLRGRARIVTALFLAAACLLPWLLQPAPAAWICWKESEVNSEERRAWTRDAALFLSREYQPGDGLLLSFGDLAGVLREAQIPLKEALHEGNRPAFDAAMLRPDLFLFEKWAMGFAGDRVVTAAQRYRGPRGRYELVRRVFQRNGPAVEIYRIR
jgi:hypothetical protein